MELFVTLAVVFALSFGAVAGAFISICILCIGSGSPYDHKALQDSLFTLWFPKEIREVENDPTHRKPNYVGIFATLLVLTVVTVILSRINLGGAANTSLAMVVATLKASLVALFFMHLKDERRLMFSVILIPMFFFAALFYGLMPDLVTNSFDDQKNERSGFNMSMDQDPRTSKDLGSNKADLLLNTAIGR